WRRRSGSSAWCWLPAMSSAATSSPNACWKCSRPARETERMSAGIQACYFISAVLFIIGLKSMSSPKTARKGILWAGLGVLLATASTFFHGGMDHSLLMVVALLIGGIGAWYTGRRVAMTAMPQMVALYNGMGGGAAACIAAIELFSGSVQTGS